VVARSSIFYRSAVASTRWQATKVAERSSCKQKLATDVASVEHNISNQQSDTSQNHPPRLPDLSTFFSALEQIDTSNVSNSNAVPTPVSVAAPFRMLADALGILSRELDNGSDLLEQMRQQLMGDAEMPPREVQGVGQEFLDGELISPRAMSVDIIIILNHVQSLTAYPRSPSSPQIIAPSATTRSSRVSRCLVHAEVAVFELIECARRRSLSSCCTPSLPQRPYVRSRVYSTLA